MVLAPRELKWLFPLVSGFLALTGLIIAVLPEPGAMLLTDATQWEVKALGNSRVAIADFPVQFNNTRKSATESPGGLVFRSWTPDFGVAPIDVTSGTFTPTKYLSVTVTGSSRTTKGRSTVYLDCVANGQRLEVFRGSVNVNVSEAIVAVPDSWCSEGARLRLISSEKNVNVGAGAIYGIGFLSFLKSSFIGIVPYYVVSLIVFAFVMFAGACLSVRGGFGHDPLPLAFVALGATSLGTFYLTSALPVKAGWLGPVLVLGLAACAVAFAGRDSRRAAATALAPYLRVWGIGSFVYFALLSVVSNGLGHWEPNYRFWPAIWSSDNELPWIYAEAVRRGWDLGGLFGGGWKPTDRPPLMAGAYLLLTDVFRLLQSANDGFYIRGRAYNAAAITLNSLWIPSCWWLLCTLHRGLDKQSRQAILLFVASLPVVIFNTTYGWPKAFGAAFALVAFGLAWQCRNHAKEIIPQSQIILFFLAGALSMLAHASTAMFLAPLGILFLWWTLARHPSVVGLGFSVALAIIATWSVYKSIALPSADPVTKYALTGDYGFNNPGLSLWEMLSNRYRGLDFSHWLEIKRIMLLQAFFPLHHSFTQIGLNSDFGADGIDKLRAWDALLLSGGNVGLPVMVILAIWVALRGLFSHRWKDFGSETPFLALTSVSLIAWLLVVVVFLVPPVIPVWPQAALFGLVLGSGVVVRNRYPSAFSLLLLGLLSYTALVWIVSPIRSALAIDPIAVLVLAAMLSWLVVSMLAPQPQLEGCKAQAIRTNRVKDIFDAARSTPAVRRILDASIWSFGLYALFGAALLFCGYVAFRWVHP